MSDIQPYDDAKSEFFKEFEKIRPDLVHQGVWTHEQKTEAAEVLKPNRIKLGLVAVIPLNCGGRECMYAPMAPKLHENVVKGTRCPIETAAAIQFFWDYVEELGVDPDRMVEVSIVRDLVDAEIQQMRASLRLGAEDFIQENVIGLDPEGNPVIKKELHLAIDYQGRIQKQKEKARAQLLATRADKVKAGQAVADPSQVISAAMEQLRKEENRRKKILRDKLKEMNIIDAEIIEDDDYDDEDE